MMVMMMEVGIGVGVEVVAIIVSEQFFTYGLEQLRQINLQASAWR